MKIVVFIVLALFIPAASIACQETLGYLADQIPDYRDVDLRTTREAILATNLKAAYQQAKRHGSDPAATATAQAREAAGQMATARQGAIGSASDEDWARRVLSAVDRGAALPAGTLPFRESMTSAHIKAYILASWAKRANEESAKQFACMDAASAARFIPVALPSSATPRPAGEASEARESEQESQLLADSKADLELTLRHLDTIPIGLDPSLISSGQKRQFNVVLLAAEDLLKVRKWKEWKDFTNKSGPRGRFNDAIRQYREAYKSDNRRVLLYLSIVLVDLLHNYRARNSNTSKDILVGWARELDSRKLINLDHPAISRCVAKLDSIGAFTAKTSQEQKAERIAFWKTVPLPEKPKALWSNSLHMGFQRVGGVLVSIYETRVEDYFRFADEAGLLTEDDFHGYDGKWCPEAWQKPGHPAVNMNWEYAQKFCEWLTDRERKAGLLSPRQSYRLISDIEWSLASGCIDGEGATPNEREVDAVRRLSGLSREQYKTMTAREFERFEKRQYWGDSLPPPATTGNFPDARHELTGSGTDVILYRREGSDGFEHTAPVGSFAPNALGLFDIGGNVREWTYDLDGRFSPPKQEYTERVIRDKSYSSKYKLSRFDFEKHNRGQGMQGAYAADDLGFRIVIVDAK
jgi:formylglycine-generating enzyme required for sulfatase activity